MGSKIMKKMKIFIAAFMVCSMFLMPVKANDTVTVSFEATDNTNEGVLSIENIESVNALSLNITLDTNAKLIEVVPNEDLLKQGAKFNYRYHEDTKALNLYITGKQAFAYDQKLPLAYLHFENEENTSVKLSLNPEKAGLKLVYDTFAQTLNESNGLVFTASQLSVSGSKTEEEIPDKEEVSYPAAQVIDKTTNVTIEAEEGILPKGTNANISQMKDEKKLETIKKKICELSEKFTVYDITLTHNQTLIQPKDGKLVSVRLPIPRGYDHDKLAVYCVDQEEVEVFQVEVINGMAQFKTNHFSTYVLAQTGVTPKDDPEGNNGETTNDQNHHDDANPDDDNQKNDAVTPNGESQNNASTDDKKTNNTTAQTSDTTQSELLLAACFVSIGILGILAYKRKLWKKVNK